jgi:hypothetical protein
MGLINGDHFAFSKSFNICSTVASRVGASSRTMSHSVV